MEVNNKICIVAVGYNRPMSMERLLASLSQGNYEGDIVDLFISIDRGQLQDEIIEIAENFVWNYGEKKINAFSERQGLRRHIIQCGDIVINYDAIILLEDDITVSKGFYSYAKQMISFYGDNAKIAGISLYKHYINQGTGDFFEPEFNGYDVFMMQVAQSWGQCWTKDMWLRFKHWYESNEVYAFSKDELISQLPQNIINWGNQSWLKYYMAYIVENDLYFVYPYHALSTNHTEIGQHNNISNNDYQVEMCCESFMYRCPLFENAIKYDVFFERIGMEIPKYIGKNVELDLYGNKPNCFTADILISTNQLPYKVIETWKLKYRPQEVNCRVQEYGIGIYVYDLKQEANAPKQKLDILRTRYNVRSITGKRLLKLSLKRAGESIKRRFVK